MAEVQIIIVSYRVPEKLKTCLESIATHWPGVQITVWDNFSSETQHIVKLRKKFPKVDWIFSPMNVGFAAAVNSAARRTQSKYILLLNPDAILLGSLDPLVDALDADSRICATSCMYASPNGPNWDCAHKPYNLLRTIVSHAGYSSKLRGTIFSDLYSEPPTNEVGYLTGACLLIARKAWSSVGDFDERFFLYSEEVDWAKRARDMGLRLELLPLALVEHSAQGTVIDSSSELSASSRFLRESQALYIRKNSSRLSEWIFKLSLRIMDNVQRSKRVCR